MNSNNINNTKENSTGNKEAFYGSLGSVALHLIVLISVVFMLKGSEAYSSGGGGYYVDISAVKGAPAAGQKTDNNDKPDLQQKSILPDEKPEIKETKTSLKNEQKPASDLNKSSQMPAPASAAGTSSGYGNIETAGFDTTALGLFYRESTLNVRMKYPSGWVYIDQQRKRKLDGITFWASGSNFNPPPYIHVEVVDKYIFNPDQYKFKYDFEKFTGYYNDPVEMENQVSQVIYLRTEDEEDYTIKLIMENKDAFRQFQPVFFAIVKSFKFGNSFL